ncbi:uncharacterized protein LOC133531275 [Cydia pomonella]|uniref:uncharacterized protein LOC133531275 n=1 Tax=Cydia pomonella TaxID=82600 RepID=UPI002ADDF455|nr:uncharacterized protein LOC133531275 [Cydia pomonella]
MNKKKLKNAYAAEDYPKEVLDRRRELYSKLEEEREKGKYAFIKYDKLVIKEGKPGNEKRKREASSSPNVTEQPRKQQSTTKTHRLNAFDVMRNRCNSLSTPNSPKNSTEDEIDKFYKDLESAHTMSDENVIVMGDFNAKIGCPKSDHYPVMGKHGYGVRNERGKIIKLSLYQSSKSVPKRCGHCNTAILLVVTSLCSLYVYSTHPLCTCTPTWILLRIIENNLQEALKLDKGMGCEIPKLDPFSKEVTKFDKKLPKIKCQGQDWVKCYHSKCRVMDAIKHLYEDIICTFRDILYQSDHEYTFGPPKKVGGDEIYELKESDHVKVLCVGSKKGNNIKAEYWSGNILGFRPVSPLPSPPGREDAFNVVIFGFDSTSRNGFIRRMKKSWQVLKELGYTVMEGYNVVGDATPWALFPILLGKTELELPDVRIGKDSGSLLESLPFIFYKLKQDGYRTAYFEDMPKIGTFQYRFTGFHRQPTDHYLRSFYLEEFIKRPSPFHWLTDRTKYYCVGDTPQFKVMMNITEQFLELDGKRFIFTFIADITHDEFNLIENADDDTATLLHSLMSKAEDTLIVVMGDHGIRHAKVRNTFQGKLEERLPLLALRLPARLARARPHAQRALQHNARALTTPHDLHSTILDVLDMRQHWNPYKVPGADYTRALTMLEAIPRNRSCSEAGIEPHWCACLAWHNVSTNDPLYEKTAHALLNYINSLVATVGDRCIPRTLTSTSWVLRANRRLELKNAHGFGGKTKVANENYQVKIIVGPGHGIYEASMTYLVNEDKFMIHTRDISRTNAYRSEPDCISKTHPHLDPYCYCR